MKILIIQTAFLGDAVLATVIPEKLRELYPSAELHLLVRKGNEGLFTDHPYLHILVWNKKEGKYRSLFKVLKEIRKENYDWVINLQRFASTGFLTAFSGAARRTGFDKNPFSWFFNERIRHQYNKHEIYRNLALIGQEDGRPRLYPSAAVYDKVKLPADDFITIAPASVWFTKQFPAEKWAEFLNAIHRPLRVLFIGAPADRTLSESIMARVNNPQLSMENRCGDFALLETAVVMSKARMNYTNDSGPMHIASAMNAPVRAVFCSTIESFGFGPLSDNSRVIETQEALSCRPCGIHGRKSCPEGHFRCAYSIQIPQEI